MSFALRVRHTFEDIKGDRQRRPGFILAIGAIGLLILAAIFSVMITFRVEDATYWVSHTYQVRGLLGTILAQVQDEQIRARDRLLGAQTDPSREASMPRAQLRADLDTLERLVADNPSQVAHAKQIAALVEREWKSLDAFGTAAAPATGAASAIGGEASANMAEIRARLEEFDATEGSLLGGRRALTERLQTLLLALELVSLVSAAIATTAVMSTNWSYIADLRTQAAALQLESKSRREAETLLVQSQKLELVGQLTAGIAHDFNNLLTIVIGSLDNARRRLASDPAQADGGVATSIAAARQGAEKAADLTKRLLAFSRQQPLAPRALDLNKIVSNISEVLVRTVGETIRIETVLAAGLWRAFADHSQIENAIVNLVLNARDAMPDGGRITIESANAFLDDFYVAQFGDVAAGQYVLLSVSDTGVGIPPELLSRVFDPFFTTKDVGKGTGLGLAMIHGFVKQSHGHIRIYSELGHGTSVKIYLPRMTDAAAPAAAPIVSSRTAGDAPRAKPGEVVLVVEDDEGVREFAVPAIESLGYEVLSARDGAEGLARLMEGGRIDILFTDVVLPGKMNGRQLANEAQRLRPGLGVLYTTGYTRNAIVHDGRLDADVRLLSKPYTMDQLAVSLRSLIDENQKVS